MLNPVPLCTHVKTNGEVCGSPAVSGTALCHHHSAVKTALRARPSGMGANAEFAPMQFVFPEDRASMQINFFLLLQAFNEGRIDLCTYRAMLNLLNAMAKNLGKTGSLTEAAEPPAEEQEVRNGPRSKVSNGEGQPDDQRRRGPADGRAEQTDGESVEKRQAKPEQPSGGASVNGLASAMHR